MNDAQKGFWGRIDPGVNVIDNLENNPNIVSMSKGEMYLASCTNIFRNVYGFVDSTNIGRAVDIDGNDIPRYTYPAIEYLIQFDYRKKRIFEFGTGGSTLFWMNRAREVIGVENNSEWIKTLSPKLAENARILLAEGTDFPLKIREVEGLFDVIVVDGAGYRYDCAVQALENLADGGIIILDNSDWHFNTAAMLKDAGLIQVDMTGFKPCESHASTTSIFFHRAFDFPVVADRQPAQGMASKNNHSSEWDKPAVSND